MTRGARNGLLLAAAHLALVGSLGVKLLADRATCPRVWVRSAPVDPNLPIRGRYVRLGLEVERYTSMEVSAVTVQDQLAGPAGRSWNVPIPVRLSVRDGQLFAEGVKTLTGTMGLLQTRGGRSVVRLDPVAFFIPESVADPSRRKAGEELWVEVTLPRRGPPRPIRLGVKKDGVLTPLVLR
jgi:hypothetical protein